MEAKTDEQVISQSIVAKEKQMRHLIERSTEVQEKLRQMHSPNAKLQTAEAYEMLDRSAFSTLLDKQMLHFAGLTLINLLKQK